MKVAKLHYVSVMQPDSEAPEVPDSLKRVKIYNQSARLHSDSQKEMYDS